MNSRGGSRDAATSKMEGLVIIVNGFHPLTIITKRSILDVAAALDSPLNRSVRNLMTSVSHVSRRFTRMRNLSMFFYIFSRVDMHTITLNSTQLRQYLKAQHMRSGIH